MRWSLVTAIALSAFQAMVCIETASCQVRQPVLRKSSKDRNPKTELSFELLLPKRGSGLRAQEWGRIFQKLKVPLRIRQSVLAEKPDISERKIGSFRRVTVLGQLAADGRITFKDRSFTQDDIAKLTDWIRDLKTYGAQGSPSGKPAFGLNKRQFGQVYLALSKPVTDDLRGLKLDAALEMIKSDDRHPFRFSAKAEEWIQRSRFQKTTRQSFKGQSKGAALSILLNNFGLGFRPKRTPSGSVELSIEPIAEATELWPIGWTLVQTRLRTAPLLFKMVPVDLDEVPIADALASIAKDSKVPIYVDYFRIELKGVDLEELKVSILPKKTSRIQVLRTLTNPNKLTRKLLIDERGKPFVWVTTLEPSRARK